MKLVSLLCLILGTACITSEPIDEQTREDSAVSPNAPDFESVGPSLREPNGPDLEIAPSDRVKLPARELPDFQIASATCVIDDDCAADETCELRRCTASTPEPGAEPL